MTRRLSGLLIATVFTVLFTLIALCAPPRAAAADYRVYEYFEGLPDDYIPAGGQGINFKESFASGSTSIGAPDVTYPATGTIYTCVGYKDANGISPASGGANSVTTTVNSDVSVTWIYQSAHKLTLGAASPNGILYGWGDNGSMQLGDGSAVNKLFLSKTSSTFEDWTVVSNSSSHSAALRSDGSLHTWGDNRYGQLGDGTTINRSSPVRVDAAARYSAVVAGRESTVAIRKDGTLWSWGHQTHGRLGNGSSAEGSVTRPVQIQAGTAWRSVAASAGFYLAIRSDGTLWGWGDNTDGNIGTGGFQDPLVPTLISSESWSVVVSGGKHSAAIKSDGTLWLWGSNGYGQLGDNSTATRVTPVQVQGGGKWKCVATGDTHTVAVKEDGTLWSWGNGLQWRLGNGLADTHIPRLVDSGADWASVAAGSSQSLGIKQDGSLWVWGVGSFGVFPGAFPLGAPTRIFADADFLQVSLNASSETVLVRRAQANNTLWGAGKNHHGQLGDGTLTDSYALKQLRNGSPNDFTVLSVGTYDTAAALRADGSLWMWGANESGQLGNGDTADTGTPFRVAPDKLFVDVAAGSNTTHAIRNDGSLWSWGYNAQGQMGVGNVADKHTPTLVGEALDWRSVVAGSDFGMAVKRDGSLWAWGENNQGRLGYAISGDVNQLRPKRVGGDDDRWRLAAAGYQRAAGIKEDGTLWLWGWNGYSQAGDNTTANIDTPKQIMIGSAWRAVALGYGHTLAVKEDGSLWAWGAGANYRLGTGALTDCKTPVQIGSSKNWRAVAAGDKLSVAIQNDGSLWGWGTGPLGAAGATTQTVLKTPTRIGAGNDWLQVSVGVFSSPNGETYRIERILGIRAASRVEISPHRGTRILTGGGQVSIEAKVIPTNGDSSYFLSDFAGGSGNIYPPTGSGYQVSIPALDRDTALTWRNEAPASGHKVNVGFSAGVPQGVQDAAGLFPGPGETTFPTGKAVTLTAPPTVTLADGTVWECYGWTGSGDVPLTGTLSSVAITSNQLSSIVWTYRVRPPDAVSFSYAVAATGPVTNADAAFLLSKQSTTIGVYESVPAGRTFTQNAQVKLTALAKVEKAGVVYFCTGISVNSADYSLPVVASDEGDRKGFVLTLTNPASMTTAWTLDVKVVYAAATKVPMGQMVQPQAGCFSAPAALKTKVALLQSANASDTLENVFYWASDSELYPVRPINLFTVTCDNGDVKNYFSEWGAVGQDGVLVGPPVNLKPGTGGFAPEAIHYSESFDYGEWTLAGGTVFQPPRAGRSLLRFSLEDSGIPAFLTVRAVASAVPAVGHATIGYAIVPEAGMHDDPEGKNGYLVNPNAHYDGAGNDGAHDRATRSGDIVPVNSNVSGNASQDLVVAWYGRGSGAAPSGKIGWPLAGKLVKYNCKWPDSPSLNVLGKGRKVVDAMQAGSIYHQPDQTLPGFNPNEEHAFLQGGKVYALRTDLNRAGTSLPYALLKYQDSGTGKWAYASLRVELPVPEVIPAVAGNPLLPPAPLNLFPASVASRHKSEDVAGNAWYFKDHSGGHWAMASSGGSEAGPSRIVMQWYYPLQPGFYYPADFRNAQGNPVKTGDPVPFQNGGANHTDPPMDLLYEVRWPTSFHTLNIGETLTDAKNGLPAVSRMAAVRKIFDAGSLKTPAVSVAQLLAPYAERSVTLASVPAGIRTETLTGGKLAFPDLPYALRSRLFYDPVAKTLGFKGLSLDTGTGEPLLLLNIMSAREREKIAALPADATPLWAAKVEELFQKAGTPLASAQVGVPQALSAGYARTSGFVVLAENDDASLGAAPVALHIIKVDGGPYRGEVKVIASDNPFDEKLTLRHSGDFAGAADQIHFSWFYQPDSSGIPPLLPASPSDSTGWTPFGSGKGMNDITIEGAGKLTLEDNWFMVRYYYGDDPASDAFDPAYPALVSIGDRAPAGVTDVDAILNNWSPWAGAPGATTAQLAEGWIKRVVDDLNPLDARVSDFRNNVTDTQVSMVAQAGGRYGGAIALNGSADNLNGIGLIEAYQTVLDRGESFSINGTPPVDSSASNNALLNAATRIADFYTLLGNEAYSDAQDPTVGYDTRGGQSGTMASSLFAFENQVDSLLEEELELLRGRDSTTSTTQASPVYNRLIWNFTNGDGELAYVQTYNVSDRNVDGFINEADAKIMYPQGHGDAWGHYLTSMTTWYALLKNGNFSWVPRSETVLVGSSPVPVDYLDERKFARTAAYKADTGAEIVDLTYRKLYVSDPAGQFGGYRDEVEVSQNGAPVPRAWGVDEWGRRAGQGAYFDWVAANAMLPAVDPDPSHSGIQKIDRDSVPELKEITSHYTRIQVKVDQANVGYNPLGLAPGVVPFDIDPNLLVSVAGREPQSHFEQIYGRAMKALENAGTVYDYATQYSQMLRGNEDSLDVFRKQVVARERSYKNQLIEIFGYPYAGDIGEGKTYAAGYDGPDLFHYNYMDVPTLTGIEGSEANVGYTASFDTSKAGDILFEGDMELHPETIEVSYPLSPDGPWQFDLPDGWGDRRAPGEVQMALQDLLRSNALYRQSMANYAVALGEIETYTTLLEAVYDIKKHQIDLKNESWTTVTTLESGILAAKEVQNVLELLAGRIEEVTETSVEGVVAVVGTANDVLAGARVVIKTVGSALKGNLETAAKVAEMAIAGAEFWVAQDERNTELNVFIDDARAEVQQLAVELEMKTDAVPPLIQDMYAQYQNTEQALGRYQAALAAGLRLMDERETYRKETAGEIQDYRYQDLGFRSFRNETLQKYRSSFDLAARYAYLAATAYDYETNLLRTDKASGSSFLAEITRQRSPGVIHDGVPMVGTAGLADPMARLNQNFGVYKTQLGFNNPQTETTPFSLRTGLFRIKADATSNATWKDELSRYKVADLNRNESFLRYCRPFTDNTDQPQPGLVIPFSTEVRFGKNFFGYPLGSGDSSYDPSRFATKIRSVGLWFKGYQGAGLADTPRAYLVPVGADVLRSPTGDGFEERHWQVVDQKLPVPFPISVAEIADASYLPAHVTLSEVLGGVRKFSSIRAYNDDAGIAGTAAAKLGEMNTDSSLVGRSVWNNQWLLIIPGGYLLDDPDTGLNNFVDNVTDIRLFFQTYSFSGN